MTESNRKGLYHRTMKLAQDLANENSRDPSTKVGAVILRPDKTCASLGYNGFPRGVKDTPERYKDRDLKYKLVVHAELNAILTAREPLANYTLVSTVLPCNECAKAIIQSGLACVVCPEPTPAQTLHFERLNWKETEMMFQEAMVTIYFIKIEPTLNVFDGMRISE